MNKYNHYHKWVGWLALCLGVATMARADFSTSNNPTPNAVLGQNSVGDSGPDMPLNHVTNLGLYSPEDIAICQNGDDEYMFVSDINNARILVFKNFDSSFSSNSLPDFVLGAPNFTSKGSYFSRGVFCDGTRFLASVGNSINVWNVGNLSNGASPSGIISSSMSSPEGVWVANNKLFVADANNNRILIFNGFDGFASSQNTVNPNVILGSSKSASPVSGTSFNRPHGVYSDGTMLLVADTYNHRVLGWKTIPTTNDTPADYVFGQNYGDFTSSSIYTPSDRRSFRNPESAKFLGDTLYVVDSGHYRILSFSTNQTTGPGFENLAQNWATNCSLRVIGQQSETESTDFPENNHFYWPMGFAISKGNKFYAVENSHHRIAQWDFNFSNISIVWGQATKFTSAVNHGPWVNGIHAPRGIAANSENIFVADYANNRVLIFDKNNPQNGADALYVLGQIDFHSAYLPTDTASTFNAPYGITVDNDRLYVSDQKLNKVFYWNLTSAWYNNRPADGAIEGLTGNPGGVYSDGKYLYVCDNNNKRVLIWKTNSQLTLSNATILQPSDAASAFITPTSVFSDGNQVFVGDRDNRRILVWNDANALYSGAGNTNTKKADFVLGESDFGKKDGCTSTDLKTCLAFPDAIYGDGKRLFLGQLSTLSPLGPVDPDNTRVLDWSLPIIRNNQLPSQELWKALYSSQSKTIISYPRGLTQFDKELWISDMQGNRAYKFIDNASPYVSLTVSTRSVPTKQTQTGIVPAIDITFDNTDLNWKYLYARQEGGLPGDIDKVFLCAKDAPDCGTAPIATLTPVAGTQGLFGVTFNQVAVSATDFQLAYHISHTAHINQSVGLTLNVNSGFFGFYDNDGKDVFVSNIAGPARTSDFTQITDYPDTLVVVSSQNVASSDIAQNAYFPFLEFQLKANDDQIIWQSLKMKLTGTATNLDSVTARLSVVSNSVETILQDDISFDANGNGTVNVSRTMTPTTEKFRIYLKAGSSVTGNLGVDIDPALAPFVVAPPDTVQSFTKFGSALRNTVSHGDNILNITGFDLVPAGQTAEQATRVVLGKVTLSTNDKWTYLSHWSITRLGVNAPADVENFEFWKDDGDGVFNDTKDGRVGQSPLNTQSVADISISPELRIDSTPAVLWVTAKLTAGATPGNQVGASLNLINMECDPNTSILPSNFSLKTTNVSIVPSHDTVTVASIQLPKDLGQGDTNQDLLQLTLHTDKNTSEWQSLTVKLGGTAIASDIAKLSLYRKDGTNRTLVAQNKFTGTTSTLGFGQDEILTTSDATYYLSVDVADLAVDGHTVILSLDTPSAFKLRQAADTVAGTGFPHASDSSVIQRFPATLTITGASPSDEAREVEIGQNKVYVARLTAQVDKSYADIKSVDIHLSGTGSEDSDLVRVSLYRSNGDDILNDADQFISSAPVVQGVAHILLGSERVGVAPSDYLIGTDLSVTASPGDQLIFRVNGTDLDVFSPAKTVVSNAGGFQSQPLNVKEPITSLLLSNWTSLAPAEASQTNANVEMAAFQVRMDGYTGQWRSLRLDRTTEANFLDADVKTVRLYKDVGSVPGRYDAQDKLVAEGTFVSGSALLNFSDPSKIQTLTTTPVKYVLTVDVAGNAKPANTIGFQLSSAGNFDLSPDGVNNTGFPFATGKTIIRPTVDALDLANPGTVNVAPLKITQGDGPVAFLRFNLTAETNQVTWQGLVVESSGTLLDSDITKVRLYEDLNGNGAPDDGEEVTRGQPSFNQRLVTLRPATDVLVPTSSFGVKKYLVAIDISRLAPPGATISLRIKDLLVESPDFVRNAGNLGIGSPNDTLVGDLPDTVTPTVEPLANLVLSPTLYQGTSHAPVLRFQLRTNEDTALWTGLTAQLTLSATSPLKPEHFTAFELFKDADGSGRLDPSQTGKPLAVGTRLGQEITFTLANPETITSAGSGYFLAVSLSLDAPAGEPFSLTLKDSNAIQIASPDKLQWLTALNTPGLKVRNVKAPSTPVIADYDDPAFAKQDFLDGAFTPPDVTGRGEFSASAVQIPFTWGSQMVDGSSLTSAEYCVSLDPTQCGTKWTGFSPTPGVAVAEANGLNLSTWKVCYVLVRVRSKKFGELSEVGVSNGITIDLDRPEKPVFGAIHQESTAYSLSWNSVPPTASGNAGYILEERTDDHPLWKPIPPVTAGLKRPELTTDELAQTFVDKKPGTYYYRLTAVNGVGTKSEPSAAVRVDYALDQAPSFISATSNYPNPFDAKNGATTITYQLKDPSDVQLRIYDGFGKEVLNNNYPAGSSGGGGGSNTISWDGKDSSGHDLPQGTYVIRLNAGGEDVRWKIGVWR